MTLPDFQRMPGPSRNVYTTGGSLGEGDLALDAWGTQRTTEDRSLFHGMWSFDIPPSMWFMFENGTQVYTSTNIISNNGVAQLTADATNTTVLLESREAPRYQPNRGHKISLAGWFPNETNDGVRDFGAFTAENGVFFRLKADGMLYAVLRRGGVEVLEELIDTSPLTGFDVTKNNIYDIQFQWRSAGNYKFFIGDPATGTSKLVHTFSLLGTLTSASIEDPALPIAFKATRTTQDVEMNLGCADITSEGGKIEIYQYASAYAEAVTVTSGTERPVLVVRSPLQINSQTNTRTTQLARISVKCDKKATFKFWLTRDPSLLTGATYKPIGNGVYIETDSPDMDATAVRATAATTVGMQFLVAVPAEAQAWYQVDNPIRESINFPIVRGDYIVVTCNASANGAAEAVVEWGEAI